MMDPTEHLLCLKLSNVGNDVDNRADKRQNYRCSELVVDGRAALRGVGIVAETAVWFCPYYPLEGHTWNMLVLIYQWQKGEDTIADSRTDQEMSPTISHLKISVESTTKTSGSAETCDQPPYGNPRLSLALLWPLA
jgi:hypothetical protein